MAHKMKRLENRKDLVLKQLGHADSTKKIDTIPPNALDTLHKRFDTPALRELFDKKQFIGTTAVEVNSYLKKYNGPLSDSESTSGSEVETV